MLEDAAGRPIGKIKPYVRAVLRQALSELLFSNDPAAFAICNEAVRLVKRRKLSGLAGFVNAVLRKLAVSGKNTASRLCEGPKGESLRVSVPEWMIRRVRNEYGEEGIRSLLQVPAWT